MSDNIIPEVKFDPSLGVRIFPRPEPKNAVLVPMPAIAGSEMEIPTFIKPEWGGLQVFYGSYYAVIKEGKVVYGSAKDQWEAMHQMVRPGFWVKTAVPTAYQAQEACKIITFIPDDSGDIKEASFTLKPNDWIVRQPGAEVQHVKAENYEHIYFTSLEATSLGLTLLSSDEFAAWATDRAYNLITA